MYCIVHEQDTQEHKRISIITCMCRIVVWTRNDSLLVADHLQLADQQSYVGCSFNPLPSLPSDFQCWHNLEVLKLNCCELQVSFYK